MTWNTERLAAILCATTMQLRKGPEKVTEHIGPIEVTHVFAMPHADDLMYGFEKVDCHFLVIAVDKDRAESHKAEFIEILNQCPDLEMLASGPSYILVGAKLGDQGLAFQFFALGKVLGLWNVITPESLGLEGALANTAAGAGYIMMSGYKPS